MNKIRKIVFDRLTKEYEKIPIEILERVNKELELVKDRKYEYLILELMSMKEILSTIMLIDFNLDKDNFAITGSINDLFIAYLLEIIKFNPLDYNIEVPKQIRVGIHLPEGGKSIFLNRLGAKYNNKIKVLSNNDNYFVIDHENELEVIDNTNKINCSKGEINIINNILIYVDEKSIFTILNEIYKYKDIEIKYLDDLDELKLLFADTNHKTVFEELLLDNNIMFNYHFLSQESKEYELTYIKYYYPKIYYSVVIKYIMKDIPINILTKYNDNYELAVKDYSINGQTFEDEIILSFYKLCIDAKSKCRYFALDIKQREPIFKNITFIEHRVGNGMVDVLYKIAKEYQLNSKDSKVLISISDGDINWYISKFLSIEGCLDYKEVLSLLNPFNYKYKISNINEIVEAVNILKETNINISTDYNCVFDNKYDVVIIDSLDYLLKKIPDSISCVLKKLNSLYKEVIIFDKVKNIYNVNEDIKVSDVKYLNVKKKYMYDMVAMKDGKIEKVIGYE